MPERKRGEVPEGVARETSIEETKKLETMRAIYELNVKTDQLADLLVRVMVERGDAEELSQAHALAREVGAEWRVHLLRAAGITNEEWGSYWRKRAATED